MTPAPDLNQLARGLDALQKQVAQIQAGATDEIVRQQLGAVAPQLKASGAQFLTTYPTAMAGAQAKLQESDQRGNAVQEQLAQVRRQADAAEEAQKAAAAAPPRSVDEAIDPLLGRTLRRELLERFGSVPKGAAGTTSEAPRDWEFMEFLRKSGKLK